VAGDEWERRIEDVRRDGAALMGVPVEDVAFVKNTTEGLGFVASGLDWSTGDRVVVPDCEFPSNTIPWHALGERGVEVEWVPARGPGHEVALEDVEAALGRGGVRLVSMSWVQFGRGWRVDVPEMARVAHEHGAFFCLDAIQGLGVLPAEFAAWGVDVAMADGHKWMLAPEGVGLLAVRPSIRDHLTVLEPGWNSVPYRTDWERREWEPDPTARRFEGGTMNVGGILALGASVRLLLDASVDRVWAHVDRLCSRLAEGLAAAGATVLTRREGGGGSGIVTFAIDGADPRSLATGLREAGVICAPRGGGVRVSPHGYNTVEEIDALVEWAARRGATARA
jgi:selenocysteine lyase/cysteine desulfurase